MGASLERASDSLSFGMARDTIFLCPRRKALAEGGGSGVTSMGDSLRLGGEVVRKGRTLLSAGGET